MRSIEDVFSVVPPDLCGFGQYVDKKFDPVCPVGHVLGYNGEKLHKIFKRRTPGTIKKLSFLLGVLPEALAEFIAAWDALAEQGMPKKQAFNEALNAAVKMEKAEEERQKRLLALRIKANHPIYSNVLTKVEFLKVSYEHTHSFSLEFVPDKGWSFKELFNPEE